MFSIEMSTNVDEQGATVSVGTLFQSFGKPASFRVASDEVEEMLILRFVVSVDRRRSSCDLHVSEIVDGQMTVAFYNPKRNGSSGLLEPLGLLKLGDHALEFMFQVDCLPKSETYRLSYEFHDRRITQS